MENLSRRGFLAVATACAASLQAKTLKNIGAQIYTVRNVIDAKPLETLRAIEQIGYTEVELGQANLRIWDSLKQTKLKPVGLHIETQLFTTKQDQLGPALDDAKKRGFEYVCCPYIAPKDRGGVDMIKRLAETLNRAGEKCRASGLKLCYHDHAFEFEKVGSRTLLDVLMEETDKRNVGLELDIFWASVAGHDPVEILKKYSGRVPLLHMKNKAAGTEVRFNEQVPRTAFKEVGDGVIDIPAVLRAAGPAGVKHYFVEQDQTPGDPVESLRKSFQYLSKLNF